MSRPRKEKSRPSNDMTLEIAEVAPGGDGVAIVTHQGERRAVFVRGAAPGDRIEARVDFGPRPARGQLRNVVGAGVDRVEPACPHTMRCGGCNWMQIANDAQTRIHLEHLRAALPEAWREHPVESVRATSALRYRTRARVHVRASGGRAIVGMHAPSSHEPIEVDACTVLHPTIERARLELEPRFERAHGTGDVEIALGPPVENDDERGHVLSVRWSGALPGEVYARFERALTPTGETGLRGASIVCGEATRPAVIGDPTPWMAGADGSPLQLAVGGFAQASEEGNLLLARRVGELAASALSSVPNAHIVELYAGAGNFTVLLAPHGQLVAVESHAGACRAAQANLSARGLAGAKVVEADASTYALPKALHLLVLDPPRTGARAVCEQVAGLRNPPRFLLYVSCDLATLGRDLHTLSPLYRPHTLEAFELFPQTSHLETVVLLERVR
ncbi:class I SAM-dependent RNA methyltransferase [Pendulispora rubella]|uniref:Class I SAM-dependent RNA methyltransferase n=1 Tax=Pendulispora rubella TaxID=2741070 RepID=A0ABZ2LE41_9BACT